MLLRRCRAHPNLCKLRQLVFARAGKTPARKDVTLCAETLSGGGRLTKVAFEKLRLEFPELDLKKNFVLRQLKVDDHEQRASWSACMWQFDKRRGRACPEAGTDLLPVQRARSHTARANTRRFATQSKTKGFQVLLQPARSPEMSMLTISLFSPPADGRCAGGYGDKARLAVCS